MPTSLVPIPAHIDKNNVGMLSGVLKSLSDAIQELQQPTAPRPLWTHATAATLEATAPAAEYPDTYCLVDDINCVACSTKIAGTYTWRRADGSAL